VELLIAIAVAGMLLGVVASNMSYQRVKYRTLGGISRLQHIHSQARFEALHRHRQTWVVIDEDALTATLWGDSTTSPNGVLEVGVDEILDSYRVPNWFEFRKAGNGRAVDYFGSNHDTIEFRPDGSFVAAGTSSVPALYFADRKGNAFRLLVNAVSGSTKIQMPIEGGWTGRKERWTWTF
jgi:Tfp pilus assembly protein FimT